MASGRNGTLYVGVTSDLPQRAWHHRDGIGGGFASKHGCNRLVYYEACDTMEQAIMREKQLKGGSRKQKLAAIESFNPEWEDLFDTLA